MRNLIGLSILMVLFCGSSVQAQTPAPTFIISDTTGRFTMNANPEHNQTFGTPPVAVLTSYVFDFFLKASVTNFGSCATTPLAPVISIDGGKPTPDAANKLTFPAIKAMWPAILANTEYYACVRAIGSSPSFVSGPRSSVDADASAAPLPFGFPGTPGQPSRPTIAP